MLSLLVLWALLSTILMVPLYAVAVLISAFMSKGSQ